MNGFFLVALKNHLLHFQPVGLYWFINPETAYTFYVINTGRPREDWRSEIMENDPPDGS